MNINNIIKDLYKYQNEEFKTHFLKKVIKYFKKKTIYEINKIDDNEFELSGIKIHLLYNNYIFSLFSESDLPDNILNNFSYRKLNLNQKQLNNLFNQKFGLDYNNFKICKNISVNQQIYYIIISNEEINKKNIINIELALVLLGIESLYFLDHQNLNNYCSDIILNNSSNLFNELIELKKILDKLSWLERDRIIIFSGLIYHFLGTLYTRDIDITIFCNNDKEKYIYEQYFKNNNIDILYQIKNKKFNINSIGFMKLFLYKLPKLRNIDNILTILINPKYHFYFMGIKCFDILTNFETFTARRANAVSINDTILLKKINNIDYYDKLCINNFNLRQGESRIFTDNVINKMYLNVIDIMKKWWNINISMDYLKKHFIKCQNIISINYCNKYIKQIFKYIKNIILNYISTFDYTTIYQIGFGKMPYLKSYIKLGIENIYGTEKSIYNLNYVLKKIKKYKINYNFTTDLSLEIKSNLILILLSIQYIDLDQFFKNKFNPHTIIIILYINGSKIYNELKKNNKIEIKYKDNIYWGVYPFNDKSLQKVLFYMQDVEGYDNGIEEDLIIPDKIINTFTKNNFNLINQISLSDNELKLFQKEILFYYEILIFKNISSF